MVMSPMEQLIERFLKQALHMEVRSFFEKVLADNSARLLDERMRQFESPEIFAGMDLHEHYGDQPLDNQGQLNVTKNFIAARIDYIRDRLPPALIQNGQFADLGDSSGIFLKALGKS